MLQDANWLMMLNDMLLIKPFFKTSTNGSLQDCLF